MLVGCAVFMGILALVSAQQATAEPPAAGNVGTAVHVVIHKSFQQVDDPDQCVGASTLATIRSSVPEAN
ncbi:hypothetical protein A5724_15130 [Mycobacterium sp. ACS1612]|nr:hypothetical protein A5724_15130 [Mycobacterium sp. ACS1612]